MLLVDFADGEKVQVSQGALSFAAPGSGTLSSAAFASGDIQDAEYSEVEGGTAQFSGTGKSAFAPNTIGSAFQSIKQQYARSPKPFWIGGTALAALVLYLMSGAIVMVLIALAIGGGAYVVRFRG